MKEYVEAEHASIRGVSLWLWLWWQTEDAHLLKPRPASLWMDATGAMASKGLSRKQGNARASGVGLDERIAGRGH